jgi:hypothetical protein
MNFCRQNHKGLPSRVVLRGLRRGGYIVKRGLITFAALLIFGALSSTAGAQTPAQMTKFCRYLSKHPAVAMQLAAAQGMDGPEFLTSYCAAAANETQYSRLQYFLMTHPEVAQQLADQQAMGGVVPYQGVDPYQSVPPYAPAGPSYQPGPSYQSVPPYAAAPPYQSVPPYAAAPPYQSAYPNQPYFGATPDPIGQLAGSAITGLVTRLLGNYTGVQNYGGYNGGLGPAPQPPYSAAPYPAGP